LGAANFLIRDYRKISKVISSVNNFCIIIRMTSIETYGYGAGELAGKVSEAAFQASQPAITPKEAASLDTGVEPA
jgi:hypothetical protein